MNPYAQNKNSTAKGLFQFIDSTAQQYGLQDPFDPNQSLQAVQKLTQDNRSYLTNTLGREPSQGELYLAHQQGMGGAAKLLSNPDARAVDIVGRDAVINNKGSEDMTAGQFANQWISKFEGKEEQQMETINVELPNGMVIEGVPADITKQQLIERLKANNIDTSGFEPEQAQPEQATEIAPQEVAEEAIVEEKEPDVGRLEAGLRSYTHGSLFGGSDEAIAAIASPLAVLGDKIFGEGDLTMADARQRILQDERRRQDVAREAYPIQSIGLEVAGSAATGGGTAKLAGAVAPKAMSALSKVASANPVKATAAVGGGAGGLYGFNEGQGGLQNRLKSGAMGTALGATTGAVGGKLLNRFANKGNAAPATLGAAPNTAVSRGGLNLPVPGGSGSSVPTFEGVRGQASQLYKEAEKLGGRLSPKATKDLLTKLQTSIAPKNRVEAVTDTKAVQSVIDDLGILEKGGATFDEMRSLERIFGELAMDNADAMTGKLNRLGNVYKTAQKNLQKFITDIPEDQIEGGKLAFQLKREADKKWSQSLKINEVEKVLNRAELQEQPSTAIRSGIRTLLGNPKKKAKFSPAEQQALRKVAEMSAGTRMLRAAGSRLPATFAAGGTAFTGMNPAAMAGTAALYGGAALARKGANALQKRSVNNMLKLLENPNFNQTLVNPALVGRTGVAAGTTANNQLQRLKE